ncbi:MAG: ABC transporter substrate-binding protein [Deltaproteobacteria bacterium]|nr:ABC transporter substrate-binding protein [Deltaproteobacteria bacterium]
MRMWRTLFLALFLLVFLSGPGAAQTVLKARLLGNISTLDSAKINQVNDHAVAENIYSHLVKYKPGSVDIEPDLAVSWTISRNGEVYTFSLRKGVKWHKGFGEFTAKDVKYSIERTLDPKTKSPNAGDFSLVDRVEVIDDYTVRIFLKEPYAPFLTVTLPYRPGWILNQAAVEKFGSDYGLNPIGTGPFVFERYVPGTEVALSANKQYYAGSPKLDRIVFKPISEETVAEIALERGDVDIMYFRSPEVYQRLKAKKGIIVEEKTGPGVYSLVFNIDKKPFTDPRVRKAIHHAINKEQIVKNILGGIATRGTNVLPPNFLSYTDAVVQYDYSPEKAKKLLKEAGLGDGFKTTLYYSQLSPWPLVVPVIQEDLRKVGIEVELKGLEHASLMSFVRTRKHEFGVLPHLRPPDPDMIFHLMFHSKGSSNATGYRSEDENIEKARVEMSPDKRKAMYVQLQKKLVEDSPTVPLFYLKVLVARKPYVKGHPVDLLNGFWGYSTYVEK